MKKEIKTYHDVYEFQNSHAERFVHANWGDSGYTGPRIYIENAGDILREFSGHEDGWVADSYINEKVYRLEYGLSEYVKFKGVKDESYEYMAKQNPQLIKAITQAYEEQPTISEGQELARLIALSLCKGQFKEAETLLKNFKKRYKELKKQNKI